MKFEIKEDRYQEISDSPPFCVVHSNYTPPPSCFSRLGFQINAAVFSIVFKFPLYASRPLEINFLTFVLELLCYVTFEYDYSSHLEMFLWCFVIYIALFHAVAVQQRVHCDNPDVEGFHG